jgi:proteasome lid subunit RPN8/RPN11
LESRRSGRIAIDASLPSVEIARRVLHELYAHALEAFPEECCGLLTGDSSTLFRAAHRCRNEMTKHHEKDPVNYPRDGSQAFHMSEADYLEVMRRAEARGERVTGVYHSHVDAGAYFSELDQDFASQPLFPFRDAHHVVVSVIERKVREAGAFRWLGDEGRFEGRPLSTVNP